MNFFLTGTDTGVGKTYVGCALVREWRAEGRRAVGLKPICCGDRGDALALHAAGDQSLSLEAINPVWLQTPAAPYAASLLESRPVDLDLVRRSCRTAQLGHDHVLVEGVGGWFVPITRNYFISDLAAELGWPVIVVVANRLGALNHTLLTVRAIQAQGLTCAGVIVNELVPPSLNNALITSGNRLILETLLDVPVLGELAFGGRTVQWWRQLLSGKKTTML
ncbi:MAG TPA: dethiobiotin synthase [Chthoniobacteraceae bacterium]|jgi:dethiobiotin synthetase|nr:dethiobiotin synthase [Chthoniobacteraceae bacterium]